MAKVKLHGENAQKNIILYGVSFSITCLSILFMDFPFILIFIRKHYSIAINEKKLSPLASLKFNFLITPELLCT